MKFIIINIIFIHITKYIEKFKGTLLLLKRIINDSIIIGEFNIKKKKFHLLFNQFVRGKYLSQNVIIIFFFFKKSSFLIKYRMYDVYINRLY